MLSKSLAEGGWGGGWREGRGGSWQEWFVGRLFRFLLRLSSPTRLLGRLEVACPLMGGTPLPPLLSVLTVVVRWLWFGEELPVDQAQDKESDHSTGDDRLQVLHPELVLQLARALLKLACTVLKCVCLLVKLIQFLVSLQNLFHIVPHDPHHLIHLQQILRGCKRKEGKQEQTREEVLTWACCCAIRFWAIICCIWAGPGNGRPSGPSGRPSGPTIGFLTSPVSASPIVAQGRVSVERKDEAGVRSCNT